MSLLVVLLVSLSFFSDFAVAAIVSPVCTNATSAWVCMLSLLLCALLICCHCGQTYNTLNQNPCTIAAYLMSTCNGGCELSHLVLFYIHEPLFPYLLQRSPLMRCPWITRTGGQAVLTTAICANVTPSHIPSLVHVTYVKENNGSRTLPISNLCPFRIRGLIYLTLAGSYIRPIAQGSCPSRRELPVAIKNLIAAFDMIIGSARRFPNPIPAGTRVPLWAINDVTVRC
jgi:hypothetical protein